MAIQRLFGKKTKLGMHVKPRAKDEIDREYSHHAMMFGHITRVIMDQQQLLDQHMEALERLATEGRSLPAQPNMAKTPEAPEPKPA